MYLCYLYSDRILNLVYFHLQSLLGFEQRVMYKGRNDPSLESSLVADYHIKANLALIFEEPTLHLCFSNCLMILIDDDQFVQINVSLPQP